MDRWRISASTVPIGLAGPKLVRSSMTKLFQLRCQVGVRVGLFSITPCSNHSRAILFMWLMAKKTLDSLEENCWGYELNVNWHWSRNGQRLSGFKPSKVSGDLIQVRWVSGADEGG